MAEVGAGDDFFALGGHSLLAARLISRFARRSAPTSARAPLRGADRRGSRPRLDALLAEGRAGARGRRSSPPRGGALPLSFAQERLWFLDQLEPAAAAYNIAAAVRLRGRARPAALERALAEVVAPPRGAAHDLPAEGDGHPVQVSAVRRRSSCRWWTLTGGDRDERTASSA